MIGGTVYIASGDGGVQVLEIAEPGRLLATSRLQLTGAAEGIVSVATDGHLLYAFDGATEMFVLRPNAAAEPSLLATVSPAPLPFGVRFGNGRVFSYSGSGGFSVYDFSNPLSPAETVNFPTIDNLEGFDIEAGYAYLADRSAGLRRVDLTGPAGPVELPAIPFAADVVGVAAGNGFVYAKAEQDGVFMISVLDVSDPLVPKVVNTIPTAGAGAMRLLGTTLYLPEGTAGVRIVDVSDPRSPSEIGSTPTPGAVFDVAFAPGGRLVSRAFDGEQDSFGEFDAMLLIDAADPSAPAVLDVLPSLEETSSVIARDGLAFVANSFPDLLVYDLGRRGAIGGFGSAIWERGSRALALEGDLAYIVYESEGLAIFDVQDPSAPSVVGAVDASSLNSPTDIVVQDGYAYIPRIGGQFNNGGRLAVVDVSNPNAPDIAVPSYELEGRPGKVRAAGDLLFVGLANRGIEVIDISDPTNPEFLSLFTRVNEIFDLRVVGSTIFAAAGVRGFAIIDAGDPERLLLLRELDIFPGIDEETNEIQITDDFAFLTAREENTLYVIDISRLSNVALVGMQPLSHAPVGMDLDGDRLVVGKLGQGIDVFDINPCLVETCVADLNGDGVVDTADLGRLVRSFMQTDSEADMNNDGVVDQSDLGIMISQYGVLCPG